MQRLQIQYLRRHSVEICFRVLNERFPQSDLEKIGSQATDVILHNICFYKWDVYLFECTIDVFLELQIGVGFLATSASSVVREPRRECMLASLGSQRLSRHFHEQRLWDIMNTLPRL